MRKSNTCKYIFLCYRSHTDFLSPATDIFLDIVHVNSGEQIRVFLTTMAAPVCSLSFTGSVQISNFRLTKKNLLTTLYIDWHNCLLHYNEHMILMWNILNIQLLWVMYLEMGGNTPTIQVNLPKVAVKWQNLPDQYRKILNFWDQTVNVLYKEN